ncbi:MAG TPA: hypothetical protein VF614_13535 [Chthoniobacteraceae bacterium]|jgi:hypothetical protein
MPSPEGFITLPKGVILHLPAFRGAVAVYTPPDRALWKKRTGAEPTLIDNVRPKYLTMAQRALICDEDTLSFEAAVSAQAKLDEISFSVHAQADLPEDTVVFYDGRDQRFWAYPAA